MKIEPSLTVLCFLPPFEKLNKSHQEPGRDCPSFGKYPPFFRIENRLCFWLRGFPARLKQKFSSCLGHQITQPSTEAHFHRQHVCAIECLLVFYVESTQPSTICRALQGLLYYRYFRGTVRCARRGRVLKPSLWKRAGHGSKTEAKKQDSKLWPNTTT